MFERYNEKARRVIFYARYEASQFGSPNIEPEHILLGIVRENKELFTQLLHVSEPEALLRNRIEQRAGMREKISTSVELPLSVSAKSVLTRAHEEALAIGHKHIGSEHLLLGVIGERGSLAAEIMDENGVKYENVREQIANGSRGANG